MKTKGFASLAVLLLIAASFIGAYWKHHKQGNDNVAVRMLDSTVASEFEIAQALTGKDILQEEGVHLQRINSIESGGGTVAIQALVAHNIDYGGSAWPAWINAIAGGAKITAVVSNLATSQANPGNGLVVLADSSLHTFKDLAGKRIAVNVLGASADYDIRDLLRSNGMNFEQVQLVVVPIPNIEQALRTHQVDAAAWTMNGGVDYERTLAHGNVRELPQTRPFDLHGSQVIFGSGFRNDFIQQHPQTVIHLVNAVERSRRIIWSEYQKDPEHVRKAYADVTARKGGNPELARYYKPSYVRDHIFANDKDIQWWIDVLVAEGKLKPGQIKPGDIYSYKYDSYYNHPKETAGNTLQ